MRGLSSLIVLKRVMYTLERQLKVEENSLLPCDYFDLIGGTSTGGYAITLGRFVFAS
jgi:patatin-like phospholipase/acyl hydrolase